MQCYRETVVSFDQMKLEKVLSEVLTQQYKAEAEDESCKVEKLHLSGTVQFAGTNAD